MKKLFCFLAIAATAAFTSCSSDDDSGNNDNGGGGDVVTGITLTSSSSTVTLGSAFTFTVKNNLNEDVTAASTIYVDDTALEGNTYTAAAAGTYTVHATNGDFTSADVTVTVTEEVITISSLVVTTSETYVNIGDVVTFTATGNETIDLTADATFSVNGSEIEGNTYTAEAAGYYSVSATYETVESGEEGSTAFAVLNETIALTGSTYNHSALGLIGAVEIEDTVYAVWSVYVFESELTYDALTEYPTEYLNVRFLTPTTATEDGGLSADLPNAENTTLYDIYDVISGNEVYPVQTIESGSINFATDLNTEEEVTTIEFTIDASFNEGSTIDVDYNGALDGLYNQTNSQGRFATPSTSLQIVKIFTKEELARK